MKQCTKCKTPKPLNQFGIATNHKDGHRYDCKRCANAYSKEHRRTKVGLVTTIYTHQGITSKRRTHPPPTYTMQELKSWLFNQNLFHQLHKNWVNSGYNIKLKPSVDRLKDCSPYTFGNIQLMTWGENQDKYYSDCKKGVNNKLWKTVLQFTKDNVFVKEYHSIHQAMRETNIPRSSISHCCLNNCDYAGGFVWKYKIQS